MGLVLVKRTPITYAEHKIANANAPDTIRAAGWAAL